MRGYLSGCRFLQRAQLLFWPSLRNGKDYCGCSEEGEGNNLKCRLHLLLNLACTGVPCWLGSCSCHRQRTSQAARLER